MSDLSSSIESIPLEDSHTPSTPSTSTSTSTTNIPNTLNMTTLEASIEVDQNSDTTNETDGHGLEVEGVYTVICMIVMWCGTYIQLVDVYRIIHSTG